MTWVVPLALGGFAILLMAMFTMLSARKRHHGDRRARAAWSGPRILVHDINDDRCTGCDACVAVCPTNVLDLVANKSRVLRFQDCIQCEACMFACPTEALVMFPEGAMPPPLKVPEIDENFQTAVPGQYLIGEVAGKPLVKNAANLGRAVDRAHAARPACARARSAAATNVVDVAIVGSGPGGLSAALTCIQKGLSYVVLEKEQEIASTIARYPKGKLVMAEPYDTTNLSLLPVFDSSKEQLIPIWKELIERVGVRDQPGRVGRDACTKRATARSRSAPPSRRIARSASCCRSVRAASRVRCRSPARTCRRSSACSRIRTSGAARACSSSAAVTPPCEAALALADAGAKVMISYRGKGFNRAAPKNKQTIERYAARGPHQGQARLAGAAVRRTSR